MSRQQEHRPPKRAKKGTIDEGASLLLKMPKELRKRAEKAAEKEQLALSEWIRRKIEQAL